MSHTPQHSQAETTLAEIQKAIEKDDLEKASRLLEPIKDQHRELQLEINVLKRLRNSSTGPTKTPPYGIIAAGTGLFVILAVSLFFVLEEVDEAGSERSLAKTEKADRPKEPLETKSDIPGPDVQANVTAQRTGSDPQRPATEVITVATQPEPARPEGGKSGESQSEIRVTDPQPDQAPQTEASAGAVTAVHPQETIDQTPPQKDTAATRRPAAEEMEIPSSPHKDAPTDEFTNLVIEEETVPPANKKATNVLPPREEQALRNARPPVETPSPKLEQAAPAIVLDEESTQKAIQQNNLAAMPEQTIESTPANLKQPKPETVASVRSKEPAADTTPRPIERHGTVAPLEKIQGRTPAPTPKPATEDLEALLKNPLSFDAAKRLQRKAAEALEAQISWSISLGDQKVEFALIPAGSFVMGSATQESFRVPEERPHKVVLSESFYLGYREFTQGQWMAVPGIPALSGYAAEKDASLPVSKVSHKQVQTELLPRLQGFAPSGYVIQLPSEAQWEYACRAGSLTPFHSGAPDLLTYHAWTLEDNQMAAQAVGEKKPNAWGLFDMHGNVSEFCADYYHPEFYERASQEDPVNRNPNKYRVLRGGSWINLPQHCRSAYRSYVREDHPSEYSGFRLALIKKK